MGVEIETTAVAPAPVAQVGFGAGRYFNERGVMGLFSRRRRDHSAAASEAESSADERLHHSLPEPLDAAQPSGPAPAEEPPAVPVVPPTDDQASRWFSEAVEYEQRGDLEAAFAGFQRATAASDANQRARAWWEVGRHLATQDRVGEALQAWQAVAETGDPEFSPRALRNIGTFKEDTFGDDVGAREAYQAAIAWHHPIYSEGARVNLAQSHERHEEFPEAADLYQQVIASAHPVEADRARVLLGAMLADRLGDQDGGLRHYEEAMIRCDTEWGQRAAFNAAAIYWERGRLDDAAAAFRLVLPIADQEMPVTSAFLLGQVEHERQDVQAALDAYMLAVNASDAHGTARAARCASAKQAGVILTQRGDLTSACELFTVAAIAEDMEERARGMCLLGMCQQQRGDLQAARGAFEQVLQNPAAPADLRDTAQRGLTQCR
jgi:tetratricopeptide (TPR) repeat protein